MPHWRILIVDDEPEVRGILHEFLVSQGHEVAVMASGREALDHIGDGPAPYDLALVDWHMPGISGRDVIYGINDRSPGTVVVVTTGEVGEAIRGGRNGPGWVDVIHKPFSLRKLSNRLATALERHGASPSPSSSPPSGARPA